MSLNCNEINKILEELKLEGAFIQDIIQPGFDTLALYTYREGNAKTVIICTAQNAVRLNESRRKITKNEKPLRFMEFLKSRIKGCRINSCSQLGLERVILMELSHGGSEDSERFRLYIRLWNNAANVILCDESDLVLDSMFRRPERYEMKGEVFIPPAVDQEKLKESQERFPVRPIEAENREFNSFNEYIDWWYSEKSSSLSRASLLEKAEKWYNVTRSRQEAALKNLEEKLEAFKNAPQLKHYGDLILSFGYQLKEGSRILECEDFESGKIVHISVDPKKSAQENAADYYKQYKKAVSGTDEVQHDIAIARNNLQKLENQYENIKNEANPVKIEQLLRKNTTPKQQTKKTHPGLDYTVNGWYILVGRDANENDELLRHHVRGEDLWLHVRDFPGGYVFIKARKGKTVPLDILLDAANLAVYFSKARNAGKTDLYYTHVKYLRRAKNGPKGLVLPSQEKNLCIEPDKARLSRLDALHKGLDTSV
ncbi:MAG: NFACT RNA binding domain-containing protein [Treponema sp.]|nr:NFACT RNA binding domain-containing protein [Treponema sp.]